MKQMRKNILPLIVVGLVAAVYNALVFLVFDKDRTNVFWSAYCFTMISFALICGMTGLTFKKDTSARKIFLGLPVVYFSWVYSVIQIIVGVVFMAIARPGAEHEVLFKISVVVQLILVAFYMIATAAALAAKEYIRQDEERIAGKTFARKALLADIQALENCMADAALKKEVRALAQIVEYCDPMSHDSLLPLEREIEENVEKIRQTAERNETDTAMKLCEETKRLMEERNRKCKMLK